MKRKQFLLSLLTIIPVSKALSGNVKYGNPDDKTIRHPKVFSPKEIHIGHPYHDLYCSTMPNVKTMDLLIDEHRNRYYVCVVNHITNHIRISQMETRVYNVGYHFGVYKNAYPG